MQLQLTVEVVAKSSSIGKQHTTRKVRVPFYQMCSMQATIRDDICKLADNKYTKGNQQCRQRQAGRRRQCQVIAHQNSVTFATLTKVSHYGLPNVANNYLIEKQCPPSLIKAECTQHRAPPHTKQMFNYLNIYCCCTEPFLTARATPDVAGESPY
jgi:hypothetical protein